MVDSLSALPLAKAAAPSVFGRWRCVLALFLALITPTIGQQPAPGTAARLQQVVSKADSTAGAAATNATAQSPNTTATMAKASTNAPAKGTSAEDKRLAELLKLSFERRHAAVLKALAKKAEGEAAVTNEVERFHNDVLAGDWKAVKAYLSQLPEKHGPQVFRAILQGLQKTPTAATPALVATPEMPDPPPSGPTKPVETVLLTEDILGLADARPGDLDDADITSLGRLLSRVLNKGAALEPFIARLETGTEHLGGFDPKKRSRAAALLIAANRLTEAGPFLPSHEKSRENKDFAALDLKVRYLMATGQERQDAAALRGAWALVQEVLADKSAPSTNRELALQRTVELMPLLSRDEGVDWLRESFRQSPEQGIAILAAAGAVVSQDFHNRDMEKRRRNLELQRRVVDELLAAVGRQTKVLETALNVVALGWLQEAERSKLRHVSPRQQFGGNVMGYDAYGNPIYDNYSYRYNQPSQNPNEAPPIPLDQLLPTAPGEAWLAAIEMSVLYKVRTTMAEIFLKLEQEEKAVSWVEALAPDQPRVALNLANELLRSWGKSKDPNQDNRYRSTGRIYYGPYGAMPMPGVPLTRLVQVRTLSQLSEILSRLRSLPLPPLDDRAVVAAFAASHSPAEVFRLDDMEKVFGPAQKLKSETLAELLQTMRERLARQWRAPVVQQQARTRRNDKEVQAEVSRGYELILGLTDQALAERPDEWRLLMVHGATYFDWAEFEYGKEVALAVYTEKRDKAFETLRRAASLYSARVSRMDEKEQTPVVFQQWFNATLGASDLAFLTRQQKIDTNRIDLIRDAMLALPQDTVERHITAFGKGLTESIAGLPPELKPRYLKAGLRLVGDHESAEEARKLVAYYDGLLQEIAFHAQVDGDANVGHGKPFGVHLTIRHSADVGRESGGFAKYLMNQQSSPYYYNPMGGAPVNHRDDLEKKIRETLTDGFEILSITFHDEKVEPRGYGRPEWRETPIAYLLLKAKDARVDRIPAIQLDLDFLDKRGKVVLPVESPVVLIDARPDKPPARPLSKLSVIEILDEREGKSGKLTLEVKASGRGIIPDLGDVVELAPAGFSVEKITDHGLTVTKLDADGDGLAAVCERNWLVALVRAPGRDAPATFHFPKPKLETAELSYKRYADADLVEVKESVALAGLPLRPANYRNWALSGIVFAVCGAGLFFLLRIKKGSVAEEAALYTLPAHVTPFTVLNLLRRMEQDARLSLSSERRGELAQTIREMEQRFFGPGAETNGQADLERLARDWVGRTRS